MNPIQNNPLANPLSALPPGLSGAMPQGLAGKADTQSFAQFMMGALNEVNTMQQQADTAVEQLFTGGEANAAEVLTAVQKADMSFKMLLQIRNKLVEAYQQIQDIRI